MSFIENLNAYIANPKNRHKPISVGETPNSLLAIGAKQLPMVMNPSDADKCLGTREATRHRNSHNLSVEELGSLPGLLANPVMMFKDPKTSYITVVTDRFDKDGNPFVIGVELNLSKDWGAVNRIASIYGRERAIENFIAKNGKEVKGFIPRMIEEGNLLAVNIEKALNFLRPAGQQLPEGSEVMSFDNSIAHSLRSVKSFDKNIFNRREIMASLDAKLSWSELLGDGENAYSTDNIINRLSDWQESRSHTQIQPTTPETAGKINQNNMEEKTMSENTALLEKIKELMIKDIVDFEKSSQGDEFFEIYEDVEYDVIDSLASGGYTPEPRVVGYEKNPDYVPDEYFEKLSNDWNKKTFEEIKKRFLSPYYGDIRYFDDITQTAQQSIQSTTPNEVTEINQNNMEEKTMSENQVSATTSAENLENKDGKVMNITARVTPIENGTNLKGLANININGQFSVNSIRIVEGEHGLFVSMPTRKDQKSGEFKDIAFPITNVLREHINNIVMEAYYNPTQDKSVSEPMPIKVSLQSIMENTFNNNVKASGSVKLNDDFVVTGVRIIEGEKGLFVQMPSYQDHNGEYQSIAHPITADFYKQFQETVLHQYQNRATIIGNTKYNELGDKDNITHFTIQNKKFAEKVFAKLDEQGVKWSGKIDDKVTISVNKADEAAYKKAVTAVKPKTEKH